MKSTCLWYKSNPFTRYYYINTELTDCAGISIKFHNSLYFSFSRNSLYPSWKRRFTSLRQTPRKSLARLSKNKPSTHCQDSFMRCVSPPLTHVSKIHQHTPTSATPVYQVCFQLMMKSLICFHSIFKRMICIQETSLLRRDLQNWFICFWFNFSFVQNFPYENVPQRQNCYKYWLRS